MVFAATLGIGFFALHNYEYELKAGLVEQASSISFRGIVQEEIPSLEEKSIYLVEASQGNTASGVLSGMKFTVFGKKGFASGDILLVEGLLEKNSPRSNPGEVFEKYKIDGIYGFIRAEKMQEAVSLTVKEKIWRAFFIFKTYIRKILQESFPENRLDAEKILAGMLLGDRGMDDVQRESFQKAGVAHLFAVSGLHVGFVYMFITLLCTVLPLHRRLYSLILGFAVILYVLVTGAHPAVIRAALMLAFVFTGKILGRKSDGLTSLAAAAFLMLVINPFLLFDMGFQLSFSITGGILFSYHYIQNMLGFIPRPWMRKPLAGSISAFVASAPLTAYYFQAVYPYSIIVNLLVLPIAGFIVNLGFLAILGGTVHPALAQIVSEANYYLIISLEKVIVFFNHLPFSSLRIPLFTVLELVLLCLIFILLTRLPSFLTNPGMGLRKFFIAAGLIGIFVYSLYGKHPAFRVVFLDVGQGDCAIVQLAGGTNILVDGGGNKYSDVGMHIIIPALRNLGIKKIDLIAVSHPHSDHISGLKTVIERVPVGIVGLPDGCDNFAEGKAFLQMLEKEKVPWFFMEEGHEVKFAGGGKIDVFLPEFDPTAGQYEDLNALSAVFNLQWGGHSILFTGDVDRDGVLKLLQQERCGEVDILKFPHHGGYNSAAEEMLNLVKPEYTIISVGRNRFGHPSPKTIETIEKTEGILLRTDEAGAIEFRWHNEELTVKKYQRGI